MRTVRLFAGMPWPVRLLLINQFGIAVGFYLLIPYLATYLGGDLGLPAAVVGIVLGVRTLSQQGLTMIGGTAADRLGCRPVVIAGCALRVVAFATFAMTDSIAGIFAAAILTGLAGALFSPAVRAYLALESPDRRPAAYALHNVANDVGAMVGPLLGIVLIVVGFRTMAWASAAVFLGLTIAQALWLPPRTPARPAGSMWTSWRQVLRDRRFMTFAAGSAGLVILYNQYYLLLPLETVRVTGWVGATSGVFLLSTVVTIASQVRITQVAARRMRPRTAVVAGFVICAVAVAAGTASATWLSPARNNGEWAIVAAALPVALATILLAAGMGLAQPFALDRAAASATDGLTGTYLGTYAMVGGVLAAAGNTAIGYLIDLGGRIGLPALPWLALILVCIVSIALVTGGEKAAPLVNRDLGSPRQPEHPHALADWQESPRTRA